MKKRDKTAPVRHTLSLSGRRKYAGLFFVSPWLIGFFLLFMIPIVWSIFYTFNSIQVTGGPLEFSFQGLTYYRTALFEHATFVRTLTESVIRMLTDLPLVLVFSLFAACLLNQKFHGRGFVRTVFLIPIIYGTGVLVLLQKNDQIYSAMQEAMLGADYDSLAGRLINLLNFREALLQSGRGTVIVMEYVIAAVDRMIDIVTLSGVQTLVFLTALQSIPQFSYEAAKVEGASALDSFFKITLPLLSPMLLTNMVYTIVDSFTRYDNEMIQLIRETSSGPSMEYSLGTTFSWIYFVTVGAIIAVLLAIVSRFVFYTNER